MRCHKCNSDQHLKKDCPNAKGGKGSAKGTGSDSTSPPSFAACWEGMTWTGIAQDTPSTTSCDHDHTKRNVYPTNTRKEDQAKWCRGYNNQGKKARIEGDQESEEVNIFRSRSGSEASEQENADER